MPCGARRELYHIAAEQREAISHLNVVKIYRTEQCEVYRLFITNNKPPTVVIPTRSEGSRGRFFAPYGKKH